MQEGPAVGGRSKGKQFVVFRRKSQITSKDKQTVKVFRRNKSKITSKDKQSVKVFGKEQVADYE